MPTVALYPTGKVPRLAFLAMHLSAVRPFIRGQNPRPETSVENTDVVATYWKFRDLTLSGDVLAARDCGG